MRWSARRSASPRPRRRPRGIASPACGRVGEAQFVFVDTPGFQTRMAAALNRTLNRTVQATLGDVDVVLLVVEAGRFGPADEQVLRAACRKASRSLLVANKLDTVQRRADLAPWLQEMQRAPPVRRVRALVGAEGRRRRAPARDRRALSARCSLGSSTRTRSPTAAIAFWPPRSCARSCFASRATSCPTPRPS